MKMQNSLIMLLVVVVSLASFWGCTPKRYEDINNSISFQQLLTPEGEYESVAWLNEDHIAFIYRPKELIAADLGKDFRISIFEISSGQTITLPHISTPASCLPRSTISELTRLPNGSLGFVHRCRLESGISGTLFMWDINQDAYIELQSYPDFLARNFSFSPDMSKFIQENGVGGGLNNELYLVDSENAITKLLIDFKRARSPAWSYDGKLIAFAGTRESSQNTDTNTWSEIESLLYYPWDIYLMDAEGSNVQILLPQVGNIYDLKWSPANENLLLFGGTAFDNKDGIWLLNISDSSVKRVWSKNTRFDWSPDGSAIVLLDSDAGISWNSITIIDITDP